MFGECHAHIFMNGHDYRQAVRTYTDHLDREDIRRKLEYYQSRKITYIRDGGDHFHAASYAAEIAHEYGITYRMPAFAIHKNGHYGKIVGRGFDTMKEYHELVKKVREENGHFIKIMLSGIMDFDREGSLTEASLSREEIHEMIHIAHEEGFSVMAHVNGAEAVRWAAEGKVDSVEHGNFVDEEAMLAMKENSTVWVPTFVTIANLIGTGRFDDAAIRRLKERQGANIRRGFELEVPIALGSDAGAFGVNHADGIYDEYEELTKLFGKSTDLDKKFKETETIIRQKF